MLFLEQIQTWRLFSKLSFFPFFVFKGHSIYFFFWQKISIVVLLMTFFNNALKGWKNFCFSMIFYIMYFIYHKSFLLKLFSFKYYLTFKHLICIWYRKVTKCGILFSLFHGKKCRLVMVHIFLLIIDLCFI